MIQDPTTGKMIGNKLEAFLYILFRDSVVLGEVSRILQDIEFKDEEFEFSNQYLAKYVENVMERLT